MACFAKGTKGLFTLLLIAVWVTLPSSAVEAIRNDRFMLRGGEPTLVPNGVCHHDNNLFCHSSNNGNDCKIGTCDNGDAQVCYNDSMCPGESTCGNYQAGICHSAMADVSAAAMDASTVATSVIMTELFPNPKNPVKDADGEYIKLFNPTAASIDLSVYKVCETKGNGKLRCTELTSNLASGTHYKLCRNEATGPHDDCDIDTNIALGNRGDEIWIEDIDEGIIVDNVTIPDATGSNAGKVYVRGSTNDALHANWSFVPVTSPPVTSPPTSYPTSVPSDVPTLAPVTEPPSDTQSDLPSGAPSSAPVTSAPSNAPSGQPSNVPTLAPVTMPPSDTPSDQPSDVPTLAPVTTAPTEAPSNQSSDVPTLAPFTMPPSDTPSDQPSDVPTIAPVSTAPTEAPSDQPSDVPTIAPITMAPSDTPSDQPSDVPTLAPVTMPPSDAPSDQASDVPTLAPVTMPPSDAPRDQPSDVPTLAPVTMAPSDTPSDQPSDVPTLAPVTMAPSDTPSDQPSDVPTLAPVTMAPSDTPSNPPSDAPSSVPSTAPSNEPITFIGPFVTPETSSEIVSIPKPSQPPEDQFNTGGFRTDCPHLQSNLLDWHSPTTWMPNAVPTSGNVTLPLSSTVVITQSIVGQLGVITIPQSSKLIIAEDLANGIVLNVKGIEVQGALTAGSETCRYETDLTITLHGSRPGDIDSFGKSPTATPTYKGISVNGGILNLHGKRYFPTWTRLAQTAPVNQTYLLLQDAVNWQPGHEIVVTTTAIHDSRNWHQNEVLTIDSLDIDPVPGVGAAVYLTTPLSYNHIANNGYQAEVGLLTRNIRVEGAAADSEPIDPDPGNCTGISHFGTDMAPCPWTDMTGFGGHIMVHMSGKGYVEGIELFRMGQTNVLGRYPMHFHMLGDCPDCYFQDSSIHRSFYRCISIHGSHNTTVSENVAYDVSGYCYYLEDGVEEDNKITYNLASHIHPVSNYIASNTGEQTIPVFSQSANLILPADVTASGYYLTNLHNDIIGNAASGGWAGFAMPVLLAPIGPNKDVNMRPGNRLTKTFDGNTAHSTGWWWSHAGAFYSGGSLYYSDSNQTLLEYNAGRDQTHGMRSPCLVDKCTSKNNCNSYCHWGERAWFNISNSKVFLTASPGLNSWSGRMEVTEFEAHDVALGLEALESGFGIKNLLVECRSGETWVMPGNGPKRVPGNGFFWYDTGQEHIITEAAFRNCGYKDGFEHYDVSDTRGCDSSDLNGCRSDSTVWGMLTHSDQFTPELMQATANIAYEDCGRRFKLHDFKHENNPSSVSGRTQNWMDTDGTASGLGEPVMIGSGLTDAGHWWKVEPDTVHDPDGPLEFIRINNGPERGLGHIRFRWRDDLTNSIGTTACKNGDRGPTDPPLSDNILCPTIGHIRHIGSMFNASNDSSGGLPITANAEVAGPVGGFGWMLSLDDGPPKRLLLDQVEVDSTTPLMLAIQYPANTSFAIVAHAAYCSPSNTHSCQETFQQVNSVAHVRFGQGNVYYFDAATSLLWIRVINFPQTYTGDNLQSEFAEWHLWNLDTPDTRSGSPNMYALDRYSFDGVTLPKFSGGNYLEIVADCAESIPGHCSQPPTYIEPDVCSSGYVQVAYDKCCVSTTSTDCEVLTTFPTLSPTPAPTFAPNSNRVSNPGFEDGVIDPWYTNAWEATTATIDTTTSHSGGSSVLVRFRSKTWEGVHQNMIEVLDPGVTYTVACWAMLKNAESEFFKLTLKIKDDSGTRYPGPTEYITNSTWTMVQKNITLSVTGNLSALDLYAEGPPADVEYWVDDVSVVPV